MATTQEHDFRDLFGEDDDEADVPIADAPAASCRSPSEPEEAEQGDVQGQRSTQSPGGSEPQAPTQPTPARGGALTTLRQACVNTLIVYRDYLGGQAILIILHCVTLTPR